jgi:predicted glycosyltransferase
MRVWIDVANSPHPLVFEPLAERLVAEGAEPAITVRDHAQTVELARQRWPDALVVGGPSPPGVIPKARAMAARVSELVRWARSARPDVALSHNSYAQLLAARMLGVPSVTAMDFEHQPANHIAFRVASRVLLPAALPTRVVKRQGAKPEKLVRYPGLKEELYLGRFEPDGGVLERLGVRSEDGDVVAVARTAPAGAVYHPRENPSFVEALRTLSAQEHVRCIVLARHPEQRHEIEQLSLPRCVLPQVAVDGRALLHSADLFVGAGGTMTREAALLGVPTFSLFAGRQPEVDRWLERQGRLERLDDPGQLQAARPRERSPAVLEELRQRGRRIEEVFVRSLTDVADIGRGSEP